MTTHSKENPGEVMAWIIVALIFAAVVVGFLLGGVFGVTMVMLAVVPVIYLVLILLTAGKL